MNLVKNEIKVKGLQVASSHQHRCTHCGFIIGVGVKHWIITYAKGELMLNGKRSVSNSQTIRVHLDCLVEVG